MKPRTLELLLVEDSITDIEVISEILEELQTELGPFRLSVAKDGEEATDRLRRKSAVGREGIDPDIILLDINMPRKNGFETLRSIKADLSIKHIPVIMLTTSSRAEDIRTSYTEGAASYVVKPLKITDLRAVLKNILIYWSRVCAFPKFPEKESGLTLIELLVVVVILGILSSAAVVKIGEALNKSKKAALVTYMTSDVRSAMHDYFLEKGSYPAGAGPVDPTVVLKAGGYLTQTVSEKTAGLNINLNTIYFSGTSLGGGGVGGLLGGAGVGGSFFIGSDNFWYASCILPPASKGLDLPCIKLTPSSLDESTTLLTP